MPVSRMDVRCEPHALVRHHSRTRCVPLALCLSVHFACQHIHTTPQVSWGGTLLWKRSLVLHYHLLPSRF